MTMLTKLQRKTLSAYYTYQSKTLRIDNGVYSVSYNVPHYSERCGWKQFGAKDESEYEYWWQEACGIVSLRMIMDALQPETASKQETVYSQIMDAIAGGAYLQKVVDGKTIPIGWIHDALANIARKRDIKGYSVQLTLPAICQAILSDKLVMASVYRPFSRFIDENAPRKKAGGHLVVISGFTWKDGKCTGFFVGDPYDTKTRKEPVDASLFEDIYSGSAILFYN